MMGMHGNGQIHVWIKIIVIDIIHKQYKYIKVIHALIINAEEEVHLMMVLFLFHFVLMINNFATMILMPR